jgi:hypothetical protein
MELIMTLLIRIISGLSEQIDFPLQKQEIMIGRDLSNDISINDRKISRRHARLTISDEGICYIEDLNSTYGTFIHGKKITKKVPIKYGLPVGLGDNIEFELLNLEIGKDQNIVTPPIKKEAEAASSPEVSADESSNSSSASIAQKVERFLFWKKIFSIDVLKRLPTWVLVTIIALIFLVIFCLIPLMIVELTNQWCTLFSGFFNSIRPGLCPF